MDDAWAHLTADAGQVGAVVKQRIHQGAVLVAGGRMHGESRRFVEHDQMPILEQHIQGDVLGDQIGQGLRRRHPQLHLIVSAQGRLGPAGDAIDTHIAGIDEFLDAGPALLRPLAHEPAIQPHRQRLRINQSQQFAGTVTEGAHGCGGSSNTIGPSTERRKSSSNRWAMRAVSPLVWRRAAALSQVSLLPAPSTATP